MLPTTQPEATAADGILGGCDLDCGGFYSDHLLSAVNKSLVSSAAVDQALERVFAMRFRLGEFDPAGMVAYQSIPPSVLQNEDATASALAAARQAMTLLANNASVLPLQGSPKVALIGPHGNDTAIMMGGKPDYYPKHIVSINEGLTAAGLDVTTVQGCEVRAHLCRVQRRRGNAALAVARAKPQCSPFPLPAAGQLAKHVWV